MITSGRQGPRFIFFMLQSLVLPEIILAASVWITDSDEQLPHTESLYNSRNILGGIISFLLEPVVNLIQTICSQKLTLYELRALPLGTRQLSDRTIRRHCFETILRQILRRQLSDTFLRQFGDILFSIYLSIVFFSVVFTTGTSHKPFE